MKFRKEKKIKEIPVLNINVEELKRSDVSASVVSQNIAWDIEKRMPYRRVMKKYLDQIMQNKGVEGAKIKLSGRLDGAEISRREQLSQGKLPLQTLRANIDYGEATAFCTYGTVGIKVWIYKGEILGES
jgi:small subunit ribosomal protein S3